MALRIDKDHSRFRDIVKGQIKKDLKKYVTNGELIGKKGNDLVSIPVPRIDIPRFTYGSRKKGGVGQGDGDVGKPVDGDGDSGASGAGDKPGQHILEVDVTLEELAQILGEELELPNIEPKGRKQIDSQKSKYTGIHVTGPESLKHFKRTFKAALKRQIISGHYNPDNPIIIPIKEDKRYRSWKVTEEPSSNAMIFYIMDVSGSMGPEQKEIVRTEAFWIDTWLNSQYKDIECRYIIHDAAAREVDSHTFYHTRESGGTIISSAYKLCHRMITEEYDPSEWNLYVFHFSDGDNWSAEDTSFCVKLLKQQLLPSVNLFAYGQVESQYGTGQFIKDLKSGLENIDNVALSKIQSKDDILASIKVFLGKGH